MPQGNRPNIILVTVHDLGRHLRCYDRDLPATPSLQRIADEGVVFEEHYSTCPLCSPARSSIITGRYPHSNGMNGLTHRGFALNADEKCLAQYFNELGYHTALYGLQHETAGDPARLGYAEIRSAPDYPREALGIVPHANEFLKRSHARPGGQAKPFLLSLGFQEIHRPYKHAGYTPIDRSLVKIPPYLPDCPEVREDLADFYGMIQTMDRAMGQLLDELDRTGLAENTLLIFTTDHGEAFPRAKSTLYDPGLGVTLLMRWPASAGKSAGFPRGARIRGMTSHVDILPTLLEIAGAGAKPERIQGVSFVPLLAGREAGREYVFAEKSWHGNEYDPMRCVRTATMCAPTKEPSICAHPRYKYIRNFEEGFLYQNPLDIKRGLSGRVMEASRHQRRAMTELYDLQADPNEMNNLAGSPQMAEIEADLSRVLADWMSETCDPLSASADKPARPIPWPQPDKEHFLNNMDAPMPPADL